MYYYSFDKIWKLVSIFKYIIVYVFNILRIFFVYFVLPSLHFFVFISVGRLHDILCT